MVRIDLTTKKAQLAVRFFTYGVMTVATIILSILLIFFALGYRLDRNFTFSQGGLLQFKSFPENASITVDGKKQSFKTPNKLNITAGDHKVSYELTGYQTWSKQIQIAAGQLLWLNYARLIPNNITTQQVRQFESLHATLPSPDRRWMLLQEKPNIPQFVLADISNEKELKYTALTIPESQLSKKEGAASSFRLVEWDLGARYLMIEHQFGDQREYIRIDRTKPSEAVNISKQFGFSLSEAHFSGSNPNQVFVNNEGVLRRLDIGSTSASGALLTGIKQFVVYGGGTIAFVHSFEDAGTPRQRMGIWKDDKTTIVRTVPAEQQVVIAYSEYDDHKYLALGSSDSTKVDIIRDPTENAAANEGNTIFATLDVGAPLLSLQFNNNGRILLAQHNQQLATYDIEEAKSYQSTLPIDVTVPLRWLDDFYLWTDAGETLHMLEFDGQNMHDITSVKSGYGVTLSENGKRLFSVGKDQAGTLSLQASRLTTEE